MNNELPPITDDDSRRFTSWVMWADKVLRENTELEAINAYLADMNEKLQDRVEELKNKLDVAIGQLTQLHREKEFD